MTHPFLLRKLGNFERALLISDQHIPFNVVSMLMLENPPSPETVLSALEKLQRRHPLLRSRIVDRAFESLPTPSLDFNVLKRDTDSKWMEIIEHEMNTRLELTKGLFRVHYLIDGGHAELVMTFHHTIIDAASGMNFLNELLRTCATPMDLPTLEVVPAAETRFPSQYQGWRGALARISYVVSQVGDEIIYQWGMRGKRKAPVHLGGRGFIQTLTLPETVVDILSRACRREKITLNSLLQAALLIAVNRVVYQHQALPMRTISFADLRPYTIPPTSEEQLGNYIAMMRYSLTVSENKNLWQIAREIHAQIYHSLKSGQKFTAEQLSEKVMQMLVTTKSIRMAVTAVNYVGAVNLQPQYGDIRVKGLHSFISSFDLGPEVGSQAWLFNDQLSWDFMFLETDMSREFAGKIVGEVMSILENAGGMPAFPVELAENL